MPRRPVLKCRANRVRCPDPTCDHVQRIVGSTIDSAKFRGRGIAACQRCGQQYFFHAADGCADVAGLWPGEAEQIDIDAPLPSIWQLLGVMEAA